MSQVDPPPVTVKPVDLGVPAGQNPNDTAPRTVNLGAGQVVPYPEPLDAAASTIGRANRRTDTKPEVLVRSALHARGLRYRKDFLLRVEGLRVRPDIVFPRQKVAVFVDGCFWHRCPDHGTDPKRNVEYWRPKLRANVNRDQRVNEALNANGWAVIRVWEHDDVESAVDRVAKAVGARSR